MTKPEDKAAFRERAREVRRGLRDKDIRSEAIHKRLKTLVTETRAKSVAWFAGTRDEVRTLPFVSEIVEDVDSLVFPRCVPGRTLRLYSVRSIDELTTGRFGIPEPAEDAKQEVDAWALDLILVPGLGFGRDGSRIGYGAGYYDRLLESARSDCALVGCCFHDQLFESVPTESHDVPMHFIVTERETVRVVS